MFIELKAVYKNIRAGFDEQPDRLPGREQHRARVPSQRVPRREQRPPCPLRLDHQQVGALRRVEAQTTEKRPRVEAEVCSTACSLRTDCSTSSRTSSCSTTAEPGGTRKIVARNHQVLGVNNAVASVQRQEELKQRVPVERRLIQYTRVEQRNSGRWLMRQHDLPDERDSGPPLTESGRRPYPLVEPGAPGSRPPRRVLAHAGQRQVLLDGVLRREGPARWCRATSPSS